MRIIGHEPDGIQAHVTQNGSGKLIAAQIGLKAELLIGLDGIGALVLKLIGAKFVQKSDAAALLVFVDQQAAAFAGDGAQGQFELRAAIAAQTVEHVASETLGMDAHQGRIAGKLAHLQHDGFLDAGFCPHNGARLGGILRGSQKFSGPSRPGAGIAPVGARSLETENSKMPETSGKIRLGSLAYVNRYWDIRRYDQSRVS